MQTFPVVSPASNFDSDIHSTARQESDWAASTLNLSCVLFRVIDAKPTAPVVSPAASRGREGCTPVQRAGAGR